MRGGSGEEKDDGGKYQPTQPSAHVGWMAGEKNIKVSRRLAGNEVLGAGSGTHKEETELAASEKRALVSTCQGGMTR